MRTYCSSLDPKWTFLTCHLELFCCCLVDIDLRRVVYFAPSFGMPLEAIELFTTVCPGILTETWQNTPTALRDSKLWRRQKTMKIYYRQLSDFMIKGSCESGFTVVWDIYHLSWEMDPKLIHTHICLIRIQKRKFLMGNLYFPFSHLPV